MTTTMQYPSHGVVVGLLRAVRALRKRGDVELADGVLRAVLVKLRPPKRPANQLYYPSASSWYDPDWCRQCFDDTIAPYDAPDHVATPAFVAGRDLVKRYVRWSKEQKGFKIKTDGQRFATVDEWGVPSFDRDDAHLAHTLRQGGYRWSAVSRILNNCDDGRNWERGNAGHVWVTTTAPMTNYRR